MRDTVRAAFAEQIANNRILTQDDLDRLNTKQYFNGDDIQVGDKPLFALFNRNNQKVDENISVLNLNMGMLKESHFSLIEIESAHSKVPIVKIK